ncbi:tRNA (adenosine(37)-N6)-threonylcarbamoyltransferase complex dimerization subunit type 1 TsaB [Thalassotalea sp. LPB0316]|uniref:tRNA (adenosine(37)-N6)-threonylcarbamoyltransferase complex dimerization subunit type 1 TsaB n=1 Tax=Thalassotalea sp. LPB0316 TaxID=2769490 RepID=UPI0018673FCF|nr:tRNA (adenosine(37)-N6)-threonylcarbamoyltransferase complex dimerization subunit type 1 TsaB [Thalassotalea sp. LPB0316]QOL24633.1 tRNA (adenosine(37)-N6)-threonylcarbamoyltransferase complex dimerization subunit type 1 TsaB [Thalassotalea sp. LPB0316]
MNLLAIDASTEACSVALSFEGNTYQKFELCPQSHSLLLLPMIDEVLAQANIKLSQLDGLIFGRGPGSFTGVRIGIGVAQGLAFSSDLKVVGVSTLQAMAQQAYEEEQATQVLSGIDARMAEIYLGRYQVNEQGIMQPCLDEVVIKPELAEAHLAITEPLYCVGTAWQAYDNVLSELRTEQGEPKISFPHAQYMLNIGRQAFEAGEAVTAEQAQPVYVRDTVSWKKLPGRE